MPEAETRKRGGAIGLEERLTSQKIWDIISEKPRTGLGREPKEVEKTGKPFFYPDHCGHPLAMLKLTGNETHMCTIICALCGCSPLWMFGDIEDHREFN